MLKNNTQNILDRVGGCFVCLFGFDMVNRINKLLVKLTKGHKEAI